MRENSKVFNRIPLLALVHIRTRQNDGRISLQKQTSNDKRQNNLTKLVIGMSFVSEKVLLFDPKSFRRQQCSLTLWSTYGVILCLPCATLKSFLRRAKTFAQKKNFTSFWRSFLQQLTYVICRILNNGTRWKERFSSPTFFCNGRERVAYSRGQKLLSNQFLHNLHFTEKEESMKELTLVRFPLM